MGNSCSTYTVLSFLNTLISALRAFNSILYFAQTLRNFERQYLTSLCSPYDEVLYSMDPSMERYGLRRFFITSIDLASMLVPPARIGCAVGAHDEEDNVRFLVTDNHDIII